MGVGQVLLRRLRLQLLLGFGRRLCLLLSMGEYSSVAWSG